MTRMLTRIVPAAYRLLHLEALTRTRAGEQLFLSAFFAYKKWIEDPHAAFAARHPEVFRGGHVLDVGANVGYTACVFARAISAGFSVHAFEPEQQNFERLNRVIAQHRLLDRIVPVRAAAGDEDGVSTLRLNPSHPGDHKIVAAPEGECVAVPILRIDTYVEAENLAPVKFVKIDVQGHELAVSQGMIRLIAREPELEVSFEYSGHESEPVADWYLARAFSLHLLRHDGELTPFSREAVAHALRKRRYIDLFATRMARVSGVE
ncbi:MAG: FkbM family methyltransferase [Thermoanaerobaculia bacterium]